MGPIDGPWFVRYQASVPNARGTYPGVFALCNGLARSGVLSDPDRAWWRASNDSLELAYTDPATVDPTIFDRAVHPAVSCWFKEASTHLLAHVAGYTDLLDRYAVGWARLRSRDPGAVLYEDADQIVVEPHASHRVLNTGHCTVPTTAKETIGGQPRSARQ